MKSIYIIFEDEEFDALIDLKGKITWRRFVLKGAGLPYDVVGFRQRWREMKNARNKRRSAQLGQRCEL